MKRLGWSVVAILALASPAVSQSVLESDFTIAVPLPSGETLNESTTLVPLLADTCYYWHLRLGKVKGDVDVTEIYTLPAAPADWNLGGDSTITLSDDQRTATSALSLTPEDGWIGSGWCVAEGDPEGDYSFDIMSGGRLLHRFEFEVKAI